MSGTGALNGVHLCSGWADSVVLLRYSRQLVGSCTTSAYSGKGKRKVDTRICHKVSEGNY